MGTDIVKRWFYDVIMTNICTANKKRMKKDLNVMLQRKCHCFVKKQSNKPMTAVNHLWVITAVRHTWTHTLSDHAKYTHTHTCGNLRDERLTADHQEIVEDADTKNGDARLFHQHGAGAQQQTERQRRHRNCGGENISPSAYWHTPEKSLRSHITKIQRRSGFIVIYK